MRMVENEKENNFRERRIMEITHCNGCNCMTKSIRKGRAKYICGKCGHNKTLGDVYQYEASKKLGKDEFIPNKTKHLNTTMHT